MRIIKRLNEGLDNSKFSDYNNALDNVDESDKGQLVVDQISDWDPSNLTDGFQSSLQRKIVADGWDPTDYFMIWLHNTDDNNISALDEKSAEALIKILDKDIRGVIETQDKNGRIIRRKYENLNDSKYLLEDNGLFSGTSNDIIYKLNALSMIFNKSIADQFIKLDSQGKPLIKDDAGDYLHVEERPQKDSRGKNVLDKSGNPILIPVYVKDGSDPNNPIEVPRDKVIAVHPSMADMASDGGEGEFLDTSKIKYNLDSYVKQQFILPGRDKSPSTKGTTKPTLYSILLNWPGVKLPRDRGVKFDDYPANFKQFLSNCLTDYYMKTLKDKDYKVKAEAALNKLGKLLNVPDKHADAFWNVMPNANKNTQDLGSAIVNQFFKDPTGESKLK